MEQCCQTDRIIPATEDGILEDVPPSQSIRVFGIGGAGCNIIEELRGRHNHGPHVSIYTVNRIEIEREADLTFASGIDAPLTDKDRHLISESVRPADYVILCAGLGGMTGTILLPHFANSARAHGSKVIAVVGLPFQFEGKRVSVARKAAGDLVSQADQVITFNLDSLSRAFPGNTGMNTFLSFVNGLSVTAILNVIAALEIQPFWPAAQTT